MRHAEKLRAMKFKLDALEFKLDAAEFFLDADLFFSPCGTKLLLRLAESYKYSLQKSIWDMVFLISDFI